MECSISLYLDDRRPRKNDIYIVKLRVYVPSITKTKMYTTDFEMTVSDFEKCNSKNPKGKYLDISEALNNIKTKAINAAKEFEPFTFDKFEKALYRKAGDRTNVYYHYQVAIDENREHGRIGNADNYQNSLNSFKKFIESQNTKTIESLQFSVITAEWLQRYEEYMKTNGKSTTTVSMYVRALRAIFNTAISNGDIPDKMYPFGKEKSKFKISSVKKVKKTLKQSELKTLFEAISETPEQERAKNFFFFSYNCSGMNFKDIANLRYRQIDGDRLKFFRKKTEHTTSEQTEISVYLTPFAHDVIKLYGNKEISSNDLVFNIITDEMNEEEKHKAIKNFTRSINQGLKRLAISVGVDPAISTYFARHSFSTNAIRSGASMELVSEQLGHSDLKTTQNYFSGFEDDSIEDLTKKLMTF